MRWWRPTAAGVLIFAPAMMLGAGFALVPLLSDVSSRADLLTQFLLQGCAATTVFLVLAAATRRWRTALVLLMGVILQVGQIQPPFPPNRAIAGSPSVRLVFANLWADNEKRAAAVETLFRLDADVIVMAEMIGDWEQDASKLIHAYPQRADCWTLSGCDIIMLSRFPIRQSEIPVDRWHRSRAVLAEIETPGGILKVLGTHMARPLPVGQVYHQEGHADLLTKVAREESGPLVLVGDFNAVTWGRVIRKIERESPLRASRGLEGTWPSALPWPLRLPIDHVLVNDELAIAERRVVDVPGSDHKAVVVELRLQGQ